MQYGVPFPLFRSSGTGINAFIQKTIPEKTKIVRKYSIKNEFEVSFDSSTRPIPGFHSQDGDVY